MDITEAVFPEDVVEMSGAQLDDSKGVVYFYSLDALYSVKVW